MVPRCFLVCSSNCYSVALSAATSIVAGVWSITHPAIAGRSFGRDFQYRECFDLLIMSVDPSPDPSPDPSHE